MSEHITKIREVLAETDMVLGWTASGAGGVAAPARFHTAEEAAAAVFDSTCVHNLAVHLPRLKGRTVGIVAKACDARSIIELIAEREIDREQVRIIAVNCPAVLDVKAIWSRYGYGARVEDDGSELRVNGEMVDRKTFVQAKCANCTESKFASASASERLKLSEDFKSMSVEERREFWRDQYGRCIRCHACREACPMCYCRDVCIMQTTDPHWTGGGIDAGEAEMMQLIRVNHLAGRCTACGECERACPVGIPLMLLMEEQNRAIKEMFDYRAGIDPEAKPPLLTFDIKGDAWGDA